MMNGADQAVDTSERNADLVRRFFDACSRGDVRSYLSFFAADAEVDFSDLERPYSGVYRGHEQIERLYHDLRGPWYEKTFELEDLLSTDDHVVVTVRRTARARVGPSVQSSATATIKILEAKIAAFKMFGDRSEALAAAGVSE